MQAVNNPIHVKYRPEEFDTVIGHETEKASLKAMLESNSCPQTLGFVGMSGVGKTTLAGIVGRFYGCSEENGSLEMVNAGATGGVEAIREIVETAKLYPVHGEKKVIVIDECQNLTKAAWNPFLIITEKVPKHLTWIFLTTDAECFPDAMKTRITFFRLHPVAIPKIESYLTLVNDIEEYGCPPEVISVAAEESYGSPRQALVNLSTARACKTTEEAQNVLYSAASEADVWGKIIKLLIGGEKNFQVYVKLLKNVYRFSDAKINMTKAVADSASRCGDSWQFHARLLEALDKMPMYPNDRSGKGDVFLFVMRCIL